MLICYLNTQAQKDKATFAFIEFEKEDAARAAVASTDVRFNRRPLVAFLIDLVVPAIGAVDFRQISRTSLLSLCGSCSADDY